MNDTSTSTHEAITRLATMLGESLEPGWHIDDDRVIEIIDRAREQVPVKNEAIRDRQIALEAVWACWTQGADLNAAVALVRQFIKGKQ